MSRQGTIPLNLPGLFCLWFDGTGLVHGHEDADDPECKETRQAYEQGKRVRAGHGYYIRVQATPTVLRLLVEYAESCVWANKDEPEAGELRAARQVVERAQAGLRSLGLPEVALL